LPAIGLGTEPVVGVNYNGTFNSTSSDDDWIGFVFGYEDPKHFYVVLSSKLNDTHGIDDQFRITKVNSITGLNGPELKEAILSRTSVEGQTEILWKDSTHHGWLSNKEYTWRLKARPTTGTVKLEIFEDSSLLFDTGVVSTNSTSAASSGRLGIFTYSQPNTFWYNMSYECNDSPI
jgi:hypothetical protein